MPPKDKVRKARPVKKSSTLEDKLAAKLAEASITDRMCTGELASQPNAKDIKFVNFSLSFHGEELIHDTTLELNYGRRYGLLGRNGSGKSTLLKAIAARDLNIPAHIDMYLLNEEAPPTEFTALECVVAMGKNEVARLEAEEERIMEEEGPDSSILQDIYAKLEELDPTTFEKRAGELLFGLGFKTQMMAKKTKDMSGGWRMRVALCKALFVAPTLLILDEPTNHLDLETCVWLENYLGNYPKILLLVSHSQDFLNGVCTNMIHLTPQKKFVVYGGNYATYVKTKKENEVNQKKLYEKQQEEIRHTKEFIAQCGTYANLVRQAKSRQKALDKMAENGLIEEVVEEQAVSLMFPACGQLPSPILAMQKVGFAYSGDMKDALYTNLDFGLHLDSRIVLVGPNGAGKSTLLKLFTGDLQPTTGEINRNSHLKIARYNQHTAEILDMKSTPIDFMRTSFEYMNLEVTEWRSRLGKYGITGKAQTKEISTMSDGQQTQLVFCWLAQKAPHMLLLDEPTNHLDMESIDALADAINAFEGGMVLVSHDFRLLQQTAKEILICNHKSVKKWPGSIESYKKHLQDTIKPYQG